jgi:arabinogalactan oligomer/maltooligosaccharide transport system substrate-binding protein
VVPELRAIWDAMRPSYQAVLGGAKTPRQAARDMQALALRKIAEMNE